MYVGGAIDSAQLITVARNHATPTYVKEGIHRQVLRGAGGLPLATVVDLLEGLGVTSSD